MKYICLIIIIFTLVPAKSIVEKYPSYRYVFDEFDVDKNYIFDANFVDFVDKNEKTLFAFYKHSLDRGKVILPSMKGMLIGEGVSDLFIYLSMVESGFSNNAISPKKAVGLWQFMPETAKNYNLVVCDTYDERCDVTSSTAAAIRYLNKLHRQFGKWYLAAMAYNCGEGCVERAIKKANSDDLSLLIDDRLAFVPKETRQYIKKILLLAMIGESSVLDFSNNATSKMNKSFTEVEVAGGTDLRSVAKALKMKYDTLKKMNKNIKNAKVPFDTNHYKIVIPIDKIFAFYLRYELIDNTKPKKINLISHYVVLGETLEQLAKKYDTSVDEIIDTNHLEDNFLFLDQLLLIPVKRDLFESILLGTTK